MGRKSREKKERKEYELECYNGGKTSTIRVRAKNEKEAFDKAALKLTGACFITDLTCCTSFVADFEEE